MRSTGQVKKASHHIQKEVNYMKKSTPHRINGFVLENIFKKGKDIQIYNEERLSRLSSNPVETAGDKIADTVVRENQLLGTTASSTRALPQSKPRYAEHENTYQENEIRTTEIQNKKVGFKNMLVSSGNISVNKNHDASVNENHAVSVNKNHAVSVNKNHDASVNKNHAVRSALNTPSSKLSGAREKNHNNSGRSLAQSSNINVTRNTNDKGSLINIYKELVAILEQKCSILEATSLSQDDKHLRIGNINKQIESKKRLLNSEVGILASKSHDINSNKSSDIVLNNENQDEFFNGRSDYTSDDDSFIFAASKELERKQALIVKTNDKEKTFKPEPSQKRHLAQKYDDFNNSGNIILPLGSDVEIVDDSRDNVSLAKLQSNKSDITDEAESEDSHYFSSEQEYSKHQSDVDFLEEDSFVNKGDESYNPGQSGDSEISSLDSFDQDLDKQSLKKMDAESGSMQIINFDDSFHSPTKNSQQIILSEESDDDIIELSSDYDAERETYSNHINIDSIDHDFEILSQNRNTNIKKEPGPKYNFTAEHLSDDSDDELEALVFNQIDKGKQNSLQPSNLRPAGDERYPWSDELEYNLKYKFKLNSFRSNQLDAINATLKGKDTFVLMPTGGGKSLCYQLPATVKQGKIQTTVVVSPLISLMQDQVEHLKALHINAAMISSKDSADARRESFQMFRAGELDLIYLSPEMLSKSEQCKNTIKRLYDDGKLARIVIDEAHCVSSWGHDFRPDYKLLSFFKRQYPDIPMMALTATASVRVRTDILNNLGLNNAQLFKQSFNRPNLVYMVRPKNRNSMFEMITEIKSKFSSNTGIVYCNSKKQCEDTSKLLEQNGLSCAFYHAGMDNEDRSEVQLKWQSGEIKIVCATVAFGMGIDKPDVRFVYHHTIPRSLEGYYQECGRGGRDGKVAFCTMYYQYADFKSLESQIKRDKGILNRDLKQRHLEKLHDVLNYCSNTIECRRKLVLQYFNEVFNVALCKKTCDNCKASNEVEYRDISDDAAVILSIVEKIGYEDVTANYIIDVYRGSQQQKIVNNGHNMLEEHGEGSKYLKEDVQRIIQLLLDEGYLREKTGTNGFGFANTYLKYSKKLNKRLQMTFSATRPLSSNALRQSTSDSMISDFLVKPVAVNKQDLKAFNQKKKEMLKAPQSAARRPSHGRRKSFAKKYRRLHK